MTSKERKVILTLVGIMVVIIIGIMIFKGGKKNKKTPDANENQNVVSDEKYVTNLDDGTKLNNSESFSKTKKYNDLEISNIQFTYKNGTSVLLADVKNNGKTKHEAEIVTLTILGSSGEKIDEMNAVLPTIEAGATEQLNASFSGADRVNAKDFKIEAKK